jgi:hypothetical protein
MTPKIVTGAMTKTMTNVKRRLGTLGGALRRRYGLAAGPNGAELTLAEARAELRPLGLSIRRAGGHYRVSRQGGGGTAYVSDDLANAVAVGRKLATEEDIEDLVDVEDGGDDEIAPPLYVRAEADDEAEA